jgi:hypothetical protein
MPMKLHGSAGRCSHQAHPHPLVGLGPLPVTTGHDPDRATAGPGTAVDDDASPEPATIDSPIVFEPLHLDPPPATPTALAPPPAPVEVRTTPPAVIVPALGDVTSGPDQLTPPVVAAASPAPVAALVAPAPAPLPQIEEALPQIEEALPQIQEATPVFEPGGPMLPSVVPTVPRPAVVTSFEFDPASVAPVPARQPRRRGRRRGLKLVATLVVLGGIVAAGVVFGQSYLFPGEWDTATQPYADAVEAGRDVAFAEPLAIVAEPTDDFALRLRTQLAPVSADELALWRALGLASGAVDDTTIAGQLAGWQQALYSIVDGQVYHDLAVSGPVLDAQLVQEMAAASLDQEFGWSVDQSQRTLDAAAATSAEVRRQTRAIQQSTVFDAPVPSVPTEVVDTVPPVIGYRLLAPHVFAEFDASIEPIERTNPLADLGTNGPGLLGRDTSIVATGPTLTDGANLTTPPVAMDRSFWYLVFAGYLDARTAHTASLAVVESALTGATRGATQCASATFSGGGVEQTATLRSALTAWAAAAPAEMSSSFQVLPDGTLQLVSCDPGVGFDAAVRPGVARELLAWRMAELATMEAVRVGGGGATELVDAWSFVQASPVALDLMNLAPTASPAEMATAAQNAVNALFMPLG